MSDNLWLSALAVIVLIGVSAFFSGSETALTAASRARIHHRARKGDKRAETVRRLREKKETLLGALLLGNNLVNILSASLATSVLVGLFGQAGVALATLGMTLLLLIFAEVLPKTIAITHPDQTALKVAPLVRWVVRVLAPAVIAVQWIVRGLLRAFRIAPQSATSHEAHEEELRGAIELHRSDNPDTHVERHMLRSVLELGEVETADVMTHRSRMVAVDASLPAREIVDQVLNSPYTRIPLWRDEPDNIVGVLHAKALLRAVRNSDTELSHVDLQEIAAEPWFIPDTTTLWDQLQAFRKRREHFALVVDEYGALMGMVTLEDILEEIVGDITDETDISVPGVRLQPDGSVTAAGTVTIRDLNRQFDWSLPDDKATTIAGLILYEARLIPEAGQTFEFFGFRFRILRRTGNRISAVRISPPNARRAAASAMAANAQG
ncbi:MAG: HlyC/CorC family transporter [Alphaproteobacteria bacterium]|nr:HlyC/CorC family transporter [Alphaproteobacteria bacterium]MCB9931689.1 HlyC/CorC family transporter [Alphaproteobacteria bacterium]